MKIVATTSLPALDRPNADRWNAARSREKKKRMSVLVATTSLPAVDFKRRPLERRAKSCDYTQEVRNILIRSLHRTLLFLVFH